MSQQANPTLIGAFVLGSMVLAIGGLAIFGGGRFFTERVTYVAFFDEPVSGLATGAPVTFRGVKVGEVGDIQVHVDSNDTVSIPVYLVLQRRRIREADPLAEDGDIIEKMIEHGMRAQLEMQSIVTGQLQVQLDFHPEMPLERGDATYEFPEMPTAQSSLAELTERFQSLSFEELFASTQKMITGINKLIDSPDLAGALTGLNHGIQDFRELISTTQELIATTQQEIDRVSRRFGGTLDEADTTLASMRTTLESARETMATARTVLETASESLSIVTDDSPLRYELQEALGEMTEAAKSIRVLAEYLERNPDALLRGKREIK
jgi:paraquat-inducible protein B